MASAKTAAVFSRLSSVMSRLVRSQRGETVLSPLSPSDLEEIAIELNRIASASSDADARDVVIDVLKYLEEAAAQVYDQSAREDATLEAINVFLSTCKKLSIDINRGVYGRLLEVLL